MSQARKQLKIISFIQAILMVAALIVGIAGIVSSGDAQAEAFGMDAATLAMLANILLIAAGITALLAAAQGLKGAHVPSRLGPHTQINVVSIMFSIAGAILGSAVSAAIPAIACLIVVACIASITRGVTVRKELDR